MAIVVFLLLSHKICNFGVFLLCAGCSVFVCGVRAGGLGACGCVRYGVRGCAVCWVCVAVCVFGCFVGVLYMRLGVAKWARGVALMRYAVRLRDILYIGAREEYIRSGGVCQVFLIGF